MSQAVRDERTGPPGRRDPSKGTVWAVLAGRSRQVKGDLKWLLAAFLVAGPVAYLPNILLGTALWGDPSVGADLSFTALPLPAVWFLIAVFPVTQGLAELPTYFGYVMPRLAIYTRRRSLSMLCLIFHCRLSSSRPRADAGKPSWRQGVFGLRSYAAPMSTLGRAE